MRVLLLVWNLGFTMVNYYFFVKYGYWFSYLAFIIGCLATGMSASPLVTRR